MISKLTRLALSRTISVSISVSVFGWGYGFQPSAFRFHFHSQHHLQSARGRESYMVVLLPHIDVSLSRPQECSTISVNMKCRLERSGIGTKRMGILLCTSLKSTISDSDWSLGLKRELILALLVFFVSLAPPSVPFWPTVSLRLSAFSWLFPWVAGLWVAFLSTANSVYLFKKL